jgi:hypothetical protein
MEKEKLFTLIKEKLPKNVSFIDEIADVLDISYDASYRRVKGKTALPFKEGLLLSDHFNIQLDNLFFDTKKDTTKIIVEKSHDIISDDFLLTFFEKSEKEAQVILDSKGGKIINCAKDYPLYHTDKGSFSRFRIYVLINMLSKDPKLKKITFSEFNPSDEILNKYNTFLSQYRKVSMVEIWNDSTIDNVLNQIQYFFEVGLTTKEEALSIADGLMTSLKLIKKEAKNQKRKESGNRFQLYHNNIISLLNTVVMQTGNENIVFIPFTNLTYFKVTDKVTTDHIGQHLKTQLEFSNNLSGNAAVDRNKFFNTMYQKIENRKLLLSI